ncbi:MAG: hypothetical protein FWE58_04865 [Methanobrevibacter sp.]|nr:hypothetical protein [Methanobrevibacter sp.]
MNGNTSSNGGAVFSTGDGLTITNVTFINNTASRGGAIWFANSQDRDMAVTINYANFINNRATDGSNSGGGALMITNGHSEISDSNFINNTANNNGGAINKNGGSTLGIHRCLFENNSAKSGGAIYNTNSKTTIYPTSTFINNKASINGGAIYSNTASSIDIRANINFYNNSAVEQGGAIYARHSINSTSSNYVGNTASQGGAIYSYPDTGDIWIQYNRFVNNTNDDFYLNNTTIAQNKLPNLNYNWWGDNDNTPSVVGNVNLTHWFVMQLSADDFINTTINDTTTKVGNSVNLSYSLVLYNNLTKSTSFASYGIYPSELPNFNVTLTWTGRDGTISRTVNAKVNDSEIIPFTSGSGFSIHAIGDNEDIILYQEIVNATLNIDKTASSTDATNGQLLNYTITVTNDGDNTATNVWVNETLPENLVYQGSSGDGTYYSNNGTWYIGELASGGSATIVITVLVTHGGSITNTAILNLDEFNLGTNKSSLTITVNPQKTNITINATFSEDKKTIFITGKLVDEIGDPIAGKIIELSLNGKPIGQAQTNEDGTFNLEHSQTTPFEEGTYLITAPFEGDDDYINSNASYTLRPTSSNTDLDTGSNSDEGSSSDTDSNSDTDSGSISSEETDDDPYTSNIEKSENNTNNNPVANAAMKKTGIPIMLILIILLSSLGLIIRKK